jgi:hypothetical protein
MFNACTWQVGQGKIMWQSALLEDVLGASLKTSSRSSPQGISPKSTNRSWWMVQEPFLGCLSLVQRAPLATRARKEAPFLFYALTGPLWAFLECETCPPRERHGKHLARVPLGPQRHSKPVTHDSSRTSCQGQPGGAHCGQLRS